MTLRHTELVNLAEESIVPRAAVVLGEALRPIVDKVQGRMRKAPVRGEWQTDAFEFVSRRLQWIEKAIGRLTRQINRELGKAVAEGARDADIWRAAARMEMHIEQLLEGYDQVQRTRGDARCALGLALLGDVYRDVIMQVLAWLKEIIEFVDQPRTALRRRGLPTEGHVDLEISLTLEASPELERLIGWAERRAVEPPPPPRIAVRHERDDEVEYWREEANYYRRRQDYGLLMVLSFFGLGWLLGGDDE